MSLTFWLGHAAASVFGALLVAIAAPALHRALSLSHAARGYWLGAWMLAVLPTPIAVLLQLLLPGAVASALPTFDPLPDLSQAWVLPAQALSNEAHWLPSVAPLLLALYLAGLAFSLTRWMRALHGLRRLMRSAMPVHADDLPGDATEAECARLESARIRLMITDAATTPFALRWPHPTIVLPRALMHRLEDRQRVLVLRHEAAHLARHDPHWALLIRLTGLLLWFNPLLPRIARRVQFAAELACDAAAIGTQPNMRKAYATAYLETLRMSMDRAPASPAIAFSSHATGSHRMRIEHIVHGDPRARRRPLLSLALGSLAMTLGAAFATVQASTEAATGAAVEAVVFTGPIIEGRISSGFGTVRPGISSTAHKGIDLVAARGTPIHAPATGTVVVATTRYEQQPNYGTIIVIDHGGGWQSVYAHLDALDVAVGDRVGSGQVIGRVGSTGKATGPHVHVEVLHDGERVDPASVIANPV